jgi:hypothetical protein
VSGSTGFQGALVWEGQPTNKEGKKPSRIRRRIPRIKKEERIRIIYKVFTEYTIMQQCVSSNDNSE